MSGEKHLPDGTRACPWWNPIWKDRHFPLSGYGISFTKGNTMSDGKLVLRSYILPCIKAGVPTVNGRTYCREVLQEAVKSFDDERARVIYKEPFEEHDLETNEEKYEAVGYVRELSFLPVGKYEGHLAVSVLLRPEYADKLESGEKGLTPVFVAETDGQMRVEHGAKIEAFVLCDSETKEEAVQRVKDTVTRKICAALDNYVFEPSDAASFIAPENTERAVKAFTDVFTAACTQPHEKSDTVSSTEKKEYSMPEAKVFPDPMSNVYAEAGSRVEYIRLELINRMVCEYRKKGLGIDRFLRELSWWVKVGLIRQCRHDRDTDMLYVKITPGAVWYLIDVSNMPNRY